METSIIEVSLEVKEEIIIEEVKEDIIEDPERDYTYMEMLQMITSKKPVVIEEKKVSLPPPNVQKTGTRKTSWFNFATIAKKLNRTTEHMMQYVTAELATECSLDGNKQLVIKGRFLPKQIESILTQYILAYVKCGVCKKMETTLIKDQVTRLTFMECTLCEAKRSVANIQAGFHATSKTDRKNEKAKL